VSFSVSRPPKPTSGICLIFRQLSCAPSLGSLLVFFQPALLMLFFCLEEIGNYEFPSVLYVSLLVFLQNSIVRVSTLSLFSWALALPPHTCQINSFLAIRTSSRTFPIQVERGSSFPLEIGRFRSPGPSSYSLAAVRLFSRAHRLGIPPRILAIPPITQ